MIQRKRYMPITSTNMNEKQKRFVLERLRFIRTHYGDNIISPYINSDEIGDFAFELQEKIIGESLKEEDLEKLNRFLKQFSKTRFLYIKGIEIKIEWLAIFFVGFLVYLLWIVIN